MYRILRRRLHCGPPILLLRVEIMTLQKKMVLASVLSVVISAQLITFSWACYERFCKGGRIYPVNRISDGGDFISETINVLYTYKNELVRADGKGTASWKGQGTSLTLVPEREQIEELDSLGYHFRVETEGRVVFTNLDKEDRILLSGVNDEVSEEIYWSENGLLIRDNIVIMERPCRVTCVYVRERVDRGVENSQTMLYIVPRGLSQTILISVVICFAFTVWIVSRRTERSVLVPLLKLKKGAAQVAASNLDDSINYEGRDEFGEVCTAFDNMRIKLKEYMEKIALYEEQRKEMIAGISHDLRSPLTSIKGYAIGLRDGIANTDEKRSRYCDAILTRTEDLERLTASLSLLVRAEKENSRLHLENVCVDEYIRQLLQEKQPWLEERRVEVSYKTEVPDAEVKLDIRDMQRVFMNLFDNTVRYRTAESSKVVIGVRAGGGKVKIFFTDDGPGIAPKHIGHIFETFYRADEARTSPEKGSGIGLAVVRQIIEGQGGQVSASSENGLCIEMTLPSLREAAADEENIDR